MPLDLAPFSVLKESPVCGNQISSCSSSMCFCCCLLRIHVCGHVENVTHITPYTIGQCVGSQRPRCSHSHYTHTHTHTRHPAGRNPHLHKLWLHCAVGDGEIFRGENDYRPWRAVGTSPPPPPPL